MGGDALALTLGPHPPAAARVQYTPHADSAPVRRFEIIVALPWFSLWVPAVVRLYICGADLPRWMTRGFHMGAGTRRHCVAGQAEAHPKLAACDSGIRGLSAVRNKRTSGTATMRSPAAVRHCAWCGQTSTEQHVGQPARTDSNSSETQPKGRGVNAHERAVTPQQPRRDM